MDKLKFFDKYLADYEIWYSENRYNYKSEDEAVRSFIHHHVNGYLEEYERWFKENPHIYRSQVEAVRHFVPLNKRGIEIGIGTGRFATPFNISEGVEPSAAMRNYSTRLGLTVYNGTAEELPLENQSYDFALMVTTLCLLSDYEKAFQEVKRILKPGGSFILGFVDKNMALVHIYEEFKKQNKYYSDATFYSAKEVMKLLKRNNFKDLEIIQTVFGQPTEIKRIQPYKEGYGEGGFVVIKAACKS